MTKNKEFKAIKESRDIKDFKLLKFLIIISLKIELLNGNVVQ